jgi:adenylate cyclase
VSIFYQPDEQSAIPGTPENRQAYVDLYFDPSDGVVRRDLLHRVGPDVGPADVALPMRLLEVATGSQQLRQRLVSPGHGFPLLTAGGGGYHPHESVSSPIHLQRMLAFHQPGSFPTIALRTLLEEKLSEHDQDLLRNSIVLIGNTAPSKKDFFATPFSLGPTGETRREMSGVEIHAHRLAALLAISADRPLGIRPAPRAINRAVLVLSITAALLLAEGIPSLRSSLALGISVGLLAMAISAGVLMGGIWLDAAFPLAAFSLLCIAAWTRRGVDQQRKRQQVQDLLGKSTRHSHDLEKRNQAVRALFNRFVSHDVAEELLATPAAPRRGGVLREVTILMADLRGFSLISQQHEPGDVVRLLNIYLESMIDIILKRGGTVNEVMGDAILVVFGAPTAQQNHRETAIACAVAMQMGMERVNTRNIQEGLPIVEMGIGICSGDVMVGTIGSEARAKYSVVGIAVNLASRIEALTVGGEILAAESTVQGVAAELRVIAEHQLEAKGSAGRLHVFSIAGIGGEHLLALPEKPGDMTKLKTPLNITFYLMKGKHREDTAHQAQATHAGIRAARLGLEENCLEMFADIVLHFPGIKEDIYAKVRRIGIHTADVHYTYIPDLAKARLALLVGQQEE